MQFIQKGKKYFAGPESSLLAVVVALTYIKFHFHFIDAGFWYDDDESYIHLHE